MSNDSVHNSAVSAAVTTSVEHIQLQDLPANAVRRLHKGGVRPGEPLRTRVEAQEMLNKIPPSQRAGIDSTSAGQNAQKYLSDKHASHVKPHSKGGSNHPKNIKWENAKDNIARGGKPMSWQEQMRLDAKWHFDNLAGGVKAGIKAVPLGAAIGVATTVPFSMLTNALRVIRGEISPQQAGVETLKDTLVGGAVGGTTAFAVTTVATRSKDKIYFILNKVDRKAEKDRPIEDVIKDLSQTLSDFGISEPSIYPASAWQGLLAKLIQNKVATREHKTDFKNFFLARYIEEDEDGEPYIPKLIDISPKALQDSGITTIENTVIETVVRNSGWNLLSDVFATLNKSAQAIEETFITEIKGWEIEFEELQQTIEEYKQNSDLARGKVANVKKSVEEQKQVLINTFSQLINKFAEDAKKRIEMEIEKVAKNKSQKPVHNKEDTNLLMYLWNGFASYLTASSSDPYKIRVNNKKDAEKIGKTINEYCTPVIQSFWLDTQDKLIREGTNIRETLVKEIQKEIQAISNELSKYLGSALEVEIGINQIQFPKFEFSGIDPKIQHQQQVYARTKKEKRTKSRCCESDKVYEVDVPYTETVSYYEIDLRLTCQGIQQKIDLQVQNNIELLKRVIERQISEDFQKGEKQINNYINRFQAEFDYLLKERATREVEAPNIIAYLENQRIELSEYLYELKLIKGEFDNWRPIIML